MMSGCERIITADRKNPPAPTAEGVILSHESPPEPPIFACRGPGSEVSLGARGCEIRSS